MKYFLLFILVFFPIKSFAIDNVDECKIFRDLVFENKAKLSIDETDWRMKKSFGFELYEENKGKNDWYIEKINPDLYFEYTDYDIAKIQYSYIETINGIKVENLDEKKVERELEKEKIILKFFNVDDICIRKKEIFVLSNVCINQCSKYISN